MSKNWSKLAVGLLVIGVGLYFGYRNGLIDNLHPEDIKKFILGFGILAPLVYIFLYTIRPLIFFPAGILSLAGGLAFGNMWGFLYTLIAATLSAIVAFYVARVLGKDFVQKLIKGKLERFDRTFEEQGFKIILILRLIPAFPYDMISYMAGLSKIKLKDFSIGTLVGIIPGVFAFTFLGSSLTRGMDQILIAGAVFIGVMLIPIVLRKFDLVPKKILE